MLVEQPRSRVPRGSVATESEKRHYQPQWAMCFSWLFFVCLFVALLQSHCQGVLEGPPPNNASKLVLRLEELFSVLLMCVRMLRCTTQMVALFFCCLEARDRDITSRVVVIIYQKRANC